MSLISKTKDFISTHQVTEIQAKITLQLANCFVDTYADISSKVYIDEGDEDSVVFHWRPKKGERGFVYLDIDPDGDLLLSYCAAKYEDGWDFLFKHSEYNLDTIAQKFTSINTC